MDSPPIDPSPLILKLVLVGSYGVGKTSFFMRFHDQLFPNIYARPTIGIDFKLHKVVKEGRECRYQVWDPSGGEKFRAVSPMYYRGARGLLIFVDLSIEIPIKDQLVHLMRDLEMFSSDNVCMILIGSKCDLPQKVSDEECEQYAQQYNMKFFKTSAFEDINVTGAMESIMETVYQQEKDQNIQSVQINPRRANPNPNQQAFICC
ncbi:hypothetical protein FGO68_gene1134 [Halteria grandinella]|uniref:Uncharacterized protein n=1 Tax=Halteria grandinella TaxID=5974 RepID=A0A8J8SZ12_HALGN|nr:hypothetical protein FGO68_gene1134 [Halteria grandinella]